jgi:hypothetical protein
MTSRNNDELRILEITHLWPSLEESLVLIIGNGRKAT